MSPLPPSTRRANRWLFAALVIFSIALTVLIFLWMQRVVRANGGIADPQRRTSLRIPAVDLPCAPILFCQAPRVA